MRNSDRKVKARLNILVDADLIPHLREKRINASEICNPALWKVVEDPAMIEERAKVVDKDDGTTTPFCDWTCLVSYVKERGLVTRDDFPATDRC